MQTGRQSQDPFSRNSLHTRMFTQPGNQTITNHHLAHCQTYQKPTYASMQCIIYNFLRQSPYTSRKARCLKCVCIYIYICLFTKLSWLWLCSSFKIHFPWLKYIMPYQLHSHKVRTEVFDVEYNTKQCLISKSVGPLPLNSPPSKSTNRARLYTAQEATTHPKNIKVWDCTMSYLQEYTLSERIYTSGKTRCWKWSVSACYLQRCLEYCHATKGTHTQLCRVPRGSIKSV